MGPTFFGLNSEYKVNLHKSLVSTAYYSKGAFSVRDLYQLPVFLRTAYFKQLSDVIQGESEAHKQAMKRSK